MNAIAINLCLAVFWLALGVYLLIFEWLHGEPLRYRLPLGGLNPGWLAVLFAVFNFYRVYSTWSYRQRRGRQIVEEQEFRRRFERQHLREPRPEGPPDPNFIFTEEPPTRPPEKPV